VRRAATSRSPSRYSRSKPTIADAIDVAKFTAKNGERAVGEISIGWYQVDCQRERASRVTVFSAGAAAEFGNNDRARKLVHDFPGVQFEAGVLRLA